MSERRAAVFFMNASVLGRLLSLPPDHRVVRVMPAEASRWPEEGISLVIEGPTLDAVPDHRILPVIYPAFTLHEDGRATMALKP